MQQSVFRLHILWSSGTPEPDSVRYGSRNDPTSEKLDHHHQSGPGDGAVWHFRGCKFPLYLFHSNVSFSQVFQIAFLFFILMYLFDLDITR